jgi:hypothetical protein
VDGQNLIHAYLYHHGIQCLLHNLYQNQLPSCIKSCNI